MCSLNAVATKLKVAMLTEWGNLEPGKDKSTITNIIRRAVFETIVNENIGGTFKSRLVKWEFMDENTVKFSIKKGIKFSDGSTFTSKDFIFSLNRGFFNGSYGKLPTTYKGKDVFYEVVNRLEVKLKSPVKIQGILKDLSNPTNLIYKKVDGNLLGTGAYKFVHSQKNKVVLAHNKLYPDSIKKPKLEISLDSEDLYDIYTFLPENINCKKQYKCIFSLPISHDILSLNSTDKSIFKDKKIRRSFLGLVYSLTKDSMYKDPEVLKFVKKRSQLDPQLYSEFRRGRLPQHEVDKIITYDGGKYFKTIIGNRRVKFIYHMKSKAGPYLQSLLKNKGGIRFTEDSGPTPFKKILKTLYKQYDADMLLISRRISGKTEYDSVDTLFDDSVKSNSKFDRNPRLVALFRKLENNLEKSGDKYYKDLAHAFYEEANMLHIGFTRSVLVYNSEKVKVDRKNMYSFENLPPLDIFQLK